MERTTVGFMIAGLIIILISPKAMAACMVDVHQLDVVDNVIRGNIENTGDMNESVDYDLWVEKGSQRTLVKNGSMDMIKDQTHVVSLTYSFGTGSYIIELNATADCGASDEESMGHVILEGYTCSNPFSLEGQTRCDYANLDYLECTSSGWQTISHEGNGYCYNCPDVCGDGSCNCGENTTSCNRDCGTGRCTAKYLDDYRCIGDTRERKVRLSDCTVEWRDAENCVYGCLYGQCKSGPDDIPGCGVKIKAFDYMSSVTTNGNPYVTVVIGNTGEQTETISIYLKLDGLQQVSMSGIVHAGDDFEKTLEYAPPQQVGNHQIRLDVRAVCGSKDVASATLNVVEPGEVIEPPIVIEPPEPQIVTSVDLFPVSLDISEHGSKVIVINIDSSVEQTFSINVEGVDKTWLEFPRNVLVDNHEKTVYIYVTPEASGTYDITVSLTAETEKKDFQSSVSMYVAPSETVIEDDTLMGYVIRELSGFLLFVSQNIYAVIALILIALLIVLGIGRKHLKTEYEDLLPGLIVSL